MNNSMVTDSELDELQQQVIALLLDEHVAVDTIPRREGAGALATAPASYAQERLWFLSQFRSQGDECAADPYSMPTMLRLRGELDRSALQHALQALVARHEVLRTAFARADGQAAQIFKDDAALALTVCDLSTLTTVAQEDAVVECARRDATTPFDLGHAPLLRATLLVLSEREHVLLLCMHHIVSDGWSLAVLMRDLGRLYGALVQQRPPRLARLTVQYADYALWQRAEPQQQVMARQLDYWKTQLADLPPLLLLPTDRPRPAVRTFLGASYPVRLPGATCRRLKELSREHHCTLFMTLSAAFAVFLGRHANQDDVAFGTPIAGRTRRELEDLIGFFVNTLVIRSNLAGSPSFVDLLQQVKETCLAAYAHQDVPFEQVVGALNPERSLAYDPLFQVMFVLQNNEQGVLELPGLQVEVQEIELGVSKFDLTLSLEERGEVLEGWFEYNTDLFDATTIARMAERFAVLLEGIVAIPEQPIARLPLLGTDERRRVVHDFNATGREYPDHSCVHQLIETQAARTPHALAVSYEGATLTYAELNARANQLARHLRASGVGPDRLVGVCVERGLDMVIGLLAIWKAGGAYLPLDPTYPVDRLQFMLADAEVPLLLTQIHLRDRLASGAAHVLCMDGDAALWDTQSTSNLDCISRPDSLAYVIYTSGSTGTPKGAMVEHRQVARLLDATEQSFKFDAGDVWTVFHSIAFDFSVWELWGCLVYGGRAVVVPYLTSRSPGEFLELIEREQVTVVNQTPSAFRLLIAAEAGRKLKLRLRYVIFGGEMLETSSLEEWYQRHPENDPVLVNMYGITETTVHVTYHRLGRIDTKTPANVIGRPIADLQVYLLDHLGQPVPIGVPGEIHVGGAGVCRGYLNRPSLSAARFIADPFRAQTDARLYRSGDLARWQADGTLEYLGRIDHQVKLRGFRIELGEIESKLRECAGVRDVRVFLRDNGRSEKRLVAYVIPREGRLDTAQLRAHLKSALPDYMIPTDFSSVDAFPLTSNGKIDQKALSAKPLVRDAQIAEVASATATEAIVREIWADVLGGWRGSVTTNFFDAGGSSLSIIQVQSRLAALGFGNLPVVKLFMYTTIRELAGYLDRLTSQVDVPMSSASSASEGVNRLARLRKRNVTTFATKGVS